MQIDAHTLGTLFYDLSTEQSGEPGLYVVRALLAAFGQNREEAGVIPCEMLSQPFPALHGSRGAIHPFGIGPQRSLANFGCFVVLSGRKGEWIHIPYGS